MNIGLITSNKALLLLIVWTLAYLIWEKITGNRGKLKIYPLILFYESDKFLEMIAKSAEKRRRFWRKLGAFSNRVFPLIMLLGISYITINFIAMMKNVLLLLYGLPIGTQFVVVIPTVTIPFGKFFLLLIVAITPAVILHEFFHGTVSIAEDVVVESAGFIVSLGIFGGFVEPKIDELLRESTDTIKNCMSNRDFITVDKKSAKGLRTSDNSNAGRSRTHLRRFRRIVAVGVIANLLLLAIFYATYLTIRGTHLCEEYGLRIEKIIPNSPADRYGLKYHDIILAMNNTRIRTIDDLNNFMKNAKPGHVAYITVERHGSELTIELILGKKEQRPYIGVEISQYYKSRISWISDEAMFYIYFFVYVSFIVEFLVVILNVLPCFVLDGAQWLNAYLIEKKVRHQRVIFFVVNVLVTVMLILNFTAPLVFDILH